VSVINLRLVRKSGLTLLSKATVLSVFLKYFSGAKFRRPSRGTSPKVFLRNDCQKNTKKAVGCV